MLRIIRWLCFPIARRIGWWPIGVYFALTVPLVLVRRLVWPMSPEIAAQLPAWLYPVFYAFVFGILPGILWLRNREWYRVQGRDD